MDPQTIQALMGVFQQGLQILQTAQSGAAGAPPMANGAPGAPGAMPGAAPGGMPEPDGDEDEDLYDDEDMEEDDDQPGMDDDDQDGMGAASLHDRVSQLENHTGLKKSASGGLLDKVAALEETILGTEYEGPLVARIGQLEKAAGITPEPEAPQEIALDDLIKSAIQEGIKQYAAARPAADDDEDDIIPDLSTMRKAARDGRFGKRRGRAPEVATDEDLVKSAANFGWREDSLDQPVSFGDALLLQFHAQQAGEALPFDATDDDD